MSGLRAKVEALPDHLCEHCAEYGCGVQSCEELKALIPEGAVLVTEETLAAALRRHLHDDGERLTRPLTRRPEHLTALLWDDCAAAILAKLREAS